MHTTHAQHRAVTRRTSAAAVLVAALVGAVALAVAPSGYAGASEQVGGTVLTGRAYSIGISETKIAGVVVPNGASPDTGYVSTTESGSVTRPCTKIPAGIVTATATCVGVITDAEHRSSLATTSVATAHVGVPGLPVVDAVAVNATSASSCSGAGGATTIAYLKVGTKVLIAAPTKVMPNTKISVGVLSLTLNEQVVTDNGLLVNAIHIKANVLGVAKTNIVVSSAESGVYNCGVLYPYPTD